MHESLTSLIPFSIVSHVILSLITKGGTNMAVKVKKNQGENNDHLLQRFKKMVRGARYIMDQKKHKRYERPLKQAQVRAKALMREHYRAIRKAEEMKA